MSERTDIEKAGLWVIAIFFGFLALAIFIESLLAGVVFSIIVFILFVILLALQKDYELNRTTGGVSQTIDEIDNMNGYDFEKFIGKVFSKNGYSVKQTSLSGDQGADLIITKNGDKIAVQTKRSASKISNSAIQEVVASKAYYNCNDCIVVTNNYFTKSASDLATANNVELINRDALKRLIISDSVSESDLQVKTPENSGLASTDNKIFSSNIVVWDDEIEKQDIEMLCPSCRQSFTHNIEIQKLIAGQSIETNCPNCEMTVSISL